MILGRFWVKKLDFRSFWVQKGQFWSFSAFFQPFSAIFVTFSQNHPERVPKKKGLQAGFKLQENLAKSINRKNEAASISEAKSKGSNFHYIHKNQDLEKAKEGKR